MVGFMDGWMNGWMGAWMNDRGMYGSVEGCMDG
jgi:hypothetical protein